MPKMLRKYITFLLFLSLFFNAGGSGDTSVFLTLSSLAWKEENGKVIERQVEMNWIHNNTYEEAWVCLYDHDPFDSKEDCLVKINVTNDPTGYHKTEFGFPKINFKPDNLTDECLYYWIALISSGDIILSSCYRAHSHWMINLRDQIGNYSLDELMLPGTHNSGSYQDYDPRKDNIMNRYIVTQDETIWNQLVYGNRYLDIRVAYQNDTFFITHSIFISDIPLARVIEDVKLFLNSTQEIVILDFHRFENGFNGLNSERIHLKLIQYLENELSSIMIPSSYGYKVSLNTLWENNRRLYVGYASFSTEFGFSSEYLFKKVSHQWADADNLHDLEEYFNRTVCKRIRKNLQSSMAQMTPKIAGIFLDRYKGLRVMAQMVNLEITEWFRERWWHCANIVATDYFHGNNIIEVAIEANKKRCLQLSIY